MFPWLRSLLKSLENTGKAVRCFFKKNKQINCQQHFRALLISLCCLDGWHKDVGLEVFMVVLGINMPESTGREGLGSWVLSCSARKEPGGALPASPGGLRPSPHDGSDFTATMSCLP